MKKSRYTEEQVAYALRLPNPVRPSLPSNQAEGTKSQLASDSADAAGTGVKLVSSPSGREVTTRIF